MSPHAPHPDHAARERDEQCHDLLTSLRTISGHTQLLHSARSNAQQACPSVSASPMLDPLAIMLTAIGCLKDARRDFDQR